MWVASDVLVEPDAPSVGVPSPRRTVASSGPTMSGFSSVVVATVVGAVADLGAAAVVTVVA